MTQNPFEIPQNLRDLAEKNVEQASAAYSQFNDAMKTAMNSWMSAIPNNEATAAFKPLQEKAIGFANDNAEAGLALAKELANAKDMQEIMRIQANYAQTQIQTFTQQAQELARLMMPSMSGGN